jgi:hypothetical protein
VCGHRTRHPTGAARHFQGGLPGTKPEKIEPLTRLRAGDPAGLAEVFSIGVQTNFALKVGLELPIVTVVQIDFASHALRRASFFALGHT